MLVLGIETSTRQTSVALATERGTVASMALAGDRAGHELVGPVVKQLLGWSELALTGVGGIAVGLGPGLFTGMRVGIATAKTFAQVLGVPIVGLGSLDILAFASRHSRRLICATIDARRGEIFYAFYRPLPGGVARETEIQVGSPAHLAADLDTRREDILLVGSGAREHLPDLKGLGTGVEIGSPGSDHPAATALVELAIPRFHREEFDRVFDVQPSYVRKSDAEIAWDQRRRTG